MAEIDRSIAVLATLPPPVNGLHVATQLVVESLQSVSTVRLHDWSAGPRFTGFGWRLVKGFRSLWSLVKLVQWRYHSCTLLYTVANANGGLYYNLITIAASRALGYRCVLHHHTYIYLTISDWRMALINRIIGTSGMHVVLAPEMEDRFREVYGETAQFFVLPNSYVMKTMTRTSANMLTSRTGNFRLGHISNLTLAKGLKHVLDTFEVLITTHDIQLTLAGPLMGLREKTLVEEMLARFPGRVSYLGAIYGEKKEQFYRDIDVLLFPSEMDEAQPLVILEAFAFGKPVIGYGRGSIPSLIGSDGGHTIPIHQCFETEAVKIISQWINQPDEHLNLCRSVTKKAEQLRNESQPQLELFHRTIYDRKLVACHGTIQRTNKWRI